MMNNGTNGLSAADIAAITGNNNGNAFGNDLSWLVILALFYGGGFGGFGGFGAETYS